MGTSSQTAAPEATEDDLAAGRPMRADARRNYELLVAAAREVFTAQGSEAAMETVARHAGVGVGTLYRHFPRRIDLVEAVYRTDVDRLVAEADALADAPDPWGALHAWLEAFVDYARAKRTFLNELHEAFEKNPQLKVASRERIEGALARVLDRAQDAGVVRRDVDSADVMQLLGSLCMSATLTEGQIERLLEVVEDGLRIAGD
jgi:AcrR family transcriptional regulator